MARFLDDTHARFTEHPMKDASESEVLAVLREIEADASRSLDDLTAARPGACLKPHLATYVSGLKDLRDAFRMSLESATSGSTVPDEGVPNILGAVFMMGQAQVDAEETCGPAST
jgi:hypothetical protein